MLKQHPRCWEKENLLQTGQKNTYHLMMQAMMAVREVTMSAHLAKNFSIRPPTFEGQVLRKHEAKLGMGMVLRITSTSTVCFGEFQDDLS